MVKKVATLASVLFMFTFLIPLKVFSATDHVVINEVQIAGINTSDDFIELYNPTDNDYDLTGHRLVKRTASGSSDLPIKAFENGTIIAAHSYYLWSNSGWNPEVASDASTSATIAANNGIALRNGPENTGVIVDSVAWGSVDSGHVFIEGSPYPDSPESFSSLERNGDDTDNNSLDFVINNLPNPQNSGFVSETPSPSPTESPTSSPVPTESPLPTESPTPLPTATPEPTQAPETKFLGAFALGNKIKICYIRYDYLDFGFTKIRFPKAICEYI